MEIEWATICAEVEQGQDGPNLIGIYRDGAAIRGDLPVEVTVHAVMVIRARSEELSDGAMLTATYVVKGPAGSVRAAGKADYGFDPTPDAYPHLYRRETLTVDIAIPVAQLGLYEIVMSIDGPEWTLPYLAVAAPS